MRIYFDLRLNALKVSNDMLLQNIAFQQIVLQMARQEITFATQHVTATSKHGIQ